MMKTKPLIITILALIIIAIILVFLFQPPQPKPIKLLSSKQISTAFNENWTYNCNTGLCPNFTNQNFDVTPAIKITLLPGLFTNQNLSFTQTIKLQYKVASQVIFTNDITYPNTVRQLNVDVWKFSNQSFQNIVLNNLFGILRATNTSISIVKNITNGTVGASHFIYYNAYNGTSGPGIGVDTALWAFSGDYLIFIGYTNLGPKNYTDLAPMSLNTARLLLSAQLANLNDSEK